jgi:hypothetical protein
MMRWCPRPIPHIMSGIMSRIPHRIKARVTMMQGMVANLKGQAAIENLCKVLTMTKRRKRINSWVWA